jgi:hypothetical protein
MNYTTLFQIHQPTDLFSLPDDILLVKGARNEKTA